MDDVAMVAPEVVGEFAPYVGELGGEAARRLLTDPRMATPWREIVRRAQHCEREEPSRFRQRLDGLDVRLQPQTWNGGWERPDWERATCALFLALVCECALSKRRAVRKQDVEMEANRWRVGAKLCREAQGVPHRAGVDPELKRALQVVEGYFDDWAAFIESKTDVANVIKRGTRKLGQRDGDDDTRVKVRSLSQHMLAVLGAPLDGTVALISAVVFNCKVDRTVVTNWSSELRSGN